MIGASTHVLPALRWNGGHCAPGFTTAREKSGLGTCRDVRTSPSLDEPAPAFEASIWRSQGGSLYLFDGDAFTCIAVHAASFEGWLGKRAVKNIWRMGAVGGGLQAFRDMRTGVHGEWVPVALRFDDDVITKIFPSDRSPGLLVYGRVERYFRCRSRGLL